MNNPFDLFHIGDLVTLPRTRTRTPTGYEWNALKTAVVMSAPRSISNRNPEGSRRTYDQSKCSSWQVDLCITGENRIVQHQTRFLKKVK